MLAIQAGDVVRFRDPITARYRFVQNNVGTVVRVAGAPGGGRQLCVDFDGRTVWSMEAQFELVGRAHLEHSTRESPAPREPKRRPS